MSINLSLSGYRGRLTVDLVALRNNYAFLQKQTDESVMVGAAVKADAYGLGIEQVSQALYEAGCRDFFCANIGEAIEVRALFDDVSLYVLNGYFSGLQNEYLDANAIPVIGDPTHLESYGILAERLNKKLPVVLHFNSGMNRLGFGREDIDWVMNGVGKELCAALDLRLVMSHLACADQADHSLNAFQCDYFAEIAHHFPDVPAALSNSAGIFLGQAYHFNMVRPGMALYGLNPTPQKPNPMRRVVELSLPLVRILNVKAGETIGYGATYQCTADKVVGVVAGGYADGIHWGLAGQGLKLYWQDIACPVLGRISMDMLAVNLSPAISKGAQPGMDDYLELIGPNQSEAAIGALCGSFDYEVLTGLGPRYERVYIG